MGYKGLDDGRTAIMAPIRGDLTRDTADFTLRELSGREGGCCLWQYDQLRASGMRLSVPRE